MEIDDRADERLDDAYKKLRDILLLHHFLLRKMSTLSSFLGRLVVPFPHREFRQCRKKFTEALRLLLRLVLTPDHPGPWTSGYLCVYRADRRT